VAPSRTLVGVVALCATLAAPTTAFAARNESPLATPAGPFPDVRKSVVTIDAPLPASGGPVPAACQQLRYLRYRRDGGPADPQRADAVLVIMPGTLAGGGSLQMNALQVVQNAADRGRNVEYWALDRRSNCLEDRAGLDAGLAAGDPKVSIDYYYRGREVDGRRFAGFIPSRRLRFLADFDLRQTLEDYRSVIVDGLPDAQFRRTRAFCGGHSLGGTLTGMLMAWDFAGRPGYELCAGTIALDASVAFDGVSAVAKRPFVRDVLKPVRSLTATAVRSTITSGVVPRTVDFGFISPETMGLLAGIGLNAQLRPDADVAPLIREIPRTPAVEGAMRLLHSRTAADALAPRPRLRRQRLTGEAALGAFMDDNAQPLGFIQTSFGTYTGGPVLPKRFPFPARPLMFPVADDRLYGWANYDEPLPDHRRGDGTPYTSAASEVTDIRDLALTLHGGPIEFLEQYYPTMLTADSILASLGARNGDLSRIRYEGAALTRPRLTIVGEEGLEGAYEPPGPAGVPSTVLSLPGYNHVDVITAAPVQQDGAPEPSAKAITDFVLGTAGAPATVTPAADDGGASDAQVSARLARLRDR
jgi:hypothetical protein